MKPLTTKQWRLYDFLQDQGDQWSSRRLIATKLYLDSHEKFKAFKGTNNCPIIRQVTKDIQALRNNAEINKIIISGVRGVKIANAEEVEKWLDNRFISCMGELKRYYKDIDRLKRNGQYRVTNSANQTICTATTEAKNG